jgi:hypothetical protein
MRLANQFFSHNRLPFGRAVSRFFGPVALGVGLTMALPLAVQAQTPKAAASAAHPSLTEAGTLWGNLTETEQKTLAPLAASWSSMNETRKRKWIKIADSMPSMDEAERNKLHKRMEEWAKLSRAEREQARLNFAQSKVAGKSERQASWEAYQALSPEERQKLADKAPQKPAGSTFVTKPVPREKLIDVPFTRRTPPEQRAAAATQLTVQRSTLLPAPAAGASASAPVKP